MPPEGGPGAGLQPVPVSSAAEGKRALIHVQPLGQPWHKYAHKLLSSLLLQKWIAPFLLYSLGFLKIES